MTDDLADRIWRLVFDADGDPDPAVVADLKSRISTAGLTDLIIFSHAGTTTRQPQNRSTSGGSDYWPHNSTRLARSASSACDGRRNSGVTNRSRISPGPRRTTAGEPPHWETRW